MNGKSSGGRLRTLSQRAAEKLAGAAFPAGASDLRAVIWKPSTDLAVHDAYIRFKASHAEYLDFARRRKLEFFSDTGPSGLLPSSWKQTDEFGRLDWWTPSTATPPDAAAAPLGPYGWILAKHEDGFVYILISDTGQR
jgi:hypothetical protein